jgi:hypothetical protein
MELVSGTLAELGNQTTGNKEFGKVEVLYGLSPLSYFLSNIPQISEHSRVAEYQWDV